MQLLDIVDMEAGTTVAGGRGYYLTREGVLLNQALITYALQFGYQRGFSPVHTPFFMRQVGVLALVLGLVIGSGRQQGSARESMAAEV